MKRQSHRRRASADNLAKLREQRSDREQLKLIAVRPGESKKETVRLLNRLFKEKKATNKEIAMAIFNVAADKVTPTMEARAKTIGFLHRYTTGGAK